MKTNPNDPINARPYSHDERPSGWHEGDKPQTFQAFTGLTKREYFASLVMQSLVAQYEGKDSRQYLFDINDTIPKVAVMYADLLIEELNKIKP